MRHGIALLAGGCILASASYADAVEPTFEVGVGLPELIHLRMGAFAHPRLSVQLYASNVVFNWLVGVSATGYFLGKARTHSPPRHALAGRATLAFNPLIAPLRIRGGGETIGAAALGEAGYSYVAESGFMFNAMAGALVYLDASLAAGPTVSLGAGWVF